MAAPEAPVREHRLTAPYRDPRQRRNTVDWMVTVRTDTFIEHMRFSSEEAAEEWIAEQTARNGWVRA